jgi:hypothetical protein
MLQVLKEHEKNLDTIIMQLGETVNQQTTTSKIPTHKNGQHKVILRKWLEFRDKCQHSDTITFDIENDKFKVFSLKDDVFYTYSEAISPTYPSKIVIKFEELVSTGEADIFDEKLQCGLILKLKKLKTSVPGSNDNQKLIYQVDPDDAKRWLSRELKTDKKSIMFGCIEI